MERGERIHLSVLGFFLLALIMANVFAASKLVVIDLGFHQIVVAAGVLAYPVTFLCTDLICELFGRARATFAVVIGVMVSVGLVAFIAVAKAVPSLLPEHQELYQSFFATNTRAVAASMVAYLVAQFLDVHLFHFWKRLTAGRHLWLRNNGSTVGSQLVDTVLVTTILFWGTDMDIPTLIGNSFLFKFAVALVDTPILYGLVAWLKPHVPDLEPDAPAAA